MIYHICAFLIGYILDLIIGDPMNFPHPIRLVGKLIQKLDLVLLRDIKGNRNEKKEKIYGVFLVFITLIITVSITFLIIFFSYKYNSYLGMAVEAVLTCYILAAKSLRVESQKVQKELEKNDIVAARKAVSMIVGRDTENLDFSQVTKAAVETVAENTSDGVIAPLIYTLIGGPVLGFLYKAINTMDSMVGYHNDRYENFGSCAAHLDDVVNFIPSRISAILMIVATFFLGKDYDSKNAYRIFKRDRYNHKSPNSAQTESACAGALSLQLAGDAVYFGKVVKKPYIGDPIREIEPMDITRSSRLMYMTEFLTVLIGILIIIIFEKVV